MARQHNRLPIPLLLLLLLLFTAVFHLSFVAAQQSCASRSFKTSGQQQIPTYAVCNDLPQLSSALHYTYDPASSTIDLAFAAIPPTPTGWVAWGINPSGPRMLGTQTLVAYRDGATGAVKAGTYNVSVYDPIVPGHIGYEVKGLRAEAGDDASGGDIRVFATVKLPPRTTQLYHVWQVGPGVGQGGKLVKHDFKADNMRAVGTLDLLKGQATASGSSGGAIDSKNRNRNIHGLLSAISWGVLLPTGAVIARYLKAFSSPASTAWFYLHVACQVIGYIVGTAGWATGLKLGAESKGVTYSTHRFVGIAAFAVGTVQITALLLRPNREHKYRYLWNALHHSGGYVVVALGVVNVFVGIGILGPPKAWKVAYITIVCALAAAAAGLEAASWFVGSWRRNKGNGNGIGSSSPNNGK